jgi:hypothetical protein
VGTHVSPPSSDFEQTDPPEAMLMPAPMEQM